jgi:signal transduction histidine kinase
MGVPSSADQGPPRAARSVRSQFAARLVVPVACLVLLWGAGAGAALGGALNKLSWFDSGSTDHRALVQSSAVIGAGLLVVLVAVLLTGMFARRLSHEIADLTATARRLADEQLAGATLQRPRGAEQEKVAEQDAGQDAGQAVMASRPGASRPGTATSEIAAAATALDSIRRTAIAAAAAEAGTRDGLRQILASLGKRNQSLLHRQLRIIDTLEQQAESPAALAELFTLDHLTTRMRRHAESLSILSGTTPARSWSRPVPVIDVIRAAVSEIEDYKRVVVRTDAEEAVAATAVTDMIHLLAELVENATLFSPSSTRVEVRAERVASGFAIEVEDRGLGIAPGQLREINERLADPPDFDLADADRLGLFVTGRLAARHDVQVTLGSSAYRGIKAVVLLPDSIVTMPAEPIPAEPTIGGPARLDLRSPEALSLVGAVHARSLATADTMDTMDELPPAADLEPFPEEPGGTFHGLPRRVRPGNSSPRPEDGPQSPARPSESTPPEAPAPEHARNLISSLQNSWQRARQADNTPGAALDDEET